MSIALPMATTALTSIAIPRLCALPSDINLSTSFIIKIPSFFPTPKPKILKTLSLNYSNNYFPSHLCHCSPSSALNITQDEEEKEEGEKDEEEESEGVEEESDAEEIKGSNSADDCRIYVGNLPFSTTTSELNHIFSEAGQVRSAEIIYDKVTDRSRGFGFVVMRSFDEAKQAIRMFDGSQIGGRTVKVNFPEVPRGGERKIMGPKIRNSNLNFVDTPHKIYAGNLGWRVTTQELKDTFAGQPGFVSAKVVYEKDSGRSRGFGFVSFTSAEDAESALNSMNGMELEGRPLRLNQAAERGRSVNTEAIAEQSEEAVSSFGS